jgi:isopenicillin N synthase-like dioxygenase
MWTTQKEDILGMSKQNPAPDVMLSNRDTHEDFVRGVHAIIDLVLGSLESSLRMLPGALTDMHDIDLETMDQYRMIYYPPQPEEDRRGSLRPHCDFGSMTTLFNMLGGLQFLPHGKDPEVETDWLYIQPVVGHAIINIGDIMVKFTNGALRSPMHRVVSPPGDQARLKRYSLAYFARPEVRTIVRRLDGGNVPLLKEGEIEDSLEARDWFSAKIKAFTVK